MKIRWDKTVGHSICPGKLPHFLQKFFELNMNMDKSVKFDRWKAQFTMNRRL